FEGRRDFARQRHAVVTANPALRERELVKLAAIASALAETLRQRGVASSAATVAAEAGMTIFRIAFDGWATTGPGERDLASAIRTTLEELRAVTAGPRRRPRPVSVPA
ncbi:MAG: TetR family transcriptional regulator, partial [Candidatus Dormibacteria bacterium]